MYEAIESSILENIRKAGEATLGQAGGGAATAEADRVAKESSREAFRVIDTRLQALRKKGLIEHSKGKWRLQVQTSS